MPRTSTRTARRPASPRPTPTPFTFICTTCGAVEHRRNPALPEGWATETIGNDTFAYCPDDAIDLPNRSTVQ